MVSSNFYKNLGPRKLTAIIDFLHDIIEPPKLHEDIAIHDIKILQEASPNDISFLSNTKYSEFLKTTKAVACIVPKNFVGEVNPNTLLIHAENSYFAYGKLIDFFYAPIKSYPAKIMKSAIVADSAIIGKNCYIGHNVVIEDDVIIGDNSIIEAGSFIGRGVNLGRNAKIEQHVSINYAIIGDDVVILAGAKIGQDGFGFSTEKGVHHKIFHARIVKIGNNVEIGANTTIDRGSLQDTIIEDLCRIDNLVQIGHGVKIGKGSIIVAQAGIAGSSTIGKCCALGGQVGIAGHLSIGDGVQVAAQGGVAQNIEAGKIVGGSPAVPIMDWHRQSIIMKQLLKKRPK
ncbi:MAG: UDP-3-O-(3-hydroxymyristoyl)glucosamine N-acyltransferase [Rickettsia endosymbiont of Ixodes persulcatus]|nr:UDP-3-O-(3-hydroxymyristoyl)glucosamine N-acyltransferase [Rickettsia endosymbiont of Ixodes persulcatus]MCZ6910081.1 UDP-3-O-(3-hydroxymyristoyl)glucosamine N-acyltransferase [Rickettsia endosymbiont of Ixodes persulcatus]MCZ6914248.1 UDP-3-O-(3-hydroxymyristoyl)glucosamine N-acyltransferase [Rickettsia endosymbiont of Ixodes persulcatus]MCZ6920261.1 UDP-3-O-(3-hydroxymyristoyl)glucosamine N-acyltransferase [Rickettsia endosymbiont of Ixodes persulcatus]MCZ6924710.1 UDP-3-O-(3-hydroxymyrist